MKNVMIPEELFGKIIKYHLLDQEQEADDIRKGLEKKLDAMVNRENEYEEVIEQGLEQKLDAMLRHELYAQYKTAPTEEQREQVRQEYLDRKGMQESFRW